jgi:capsular polysaccharide biosynthesis protein
MTKFKFTVKEVFTSDVTVDAEDIDAARSSVLKDFNSKKHKNYYYEVNDFAGNSLWRPRDCYKAKLNETDVTYINLTKTSDIFYQDLIKKIKNSKFFRRLVKHSPKLRSLFISINSFLAYLTMSIFRLYYSRKNLFKWIPLVSLKEHVKQNLIVKIVACNQSTVSTPIPIIFPTREIEYLSNHKETYNSDSIYIAKLDGARLFGRSNIIFANESAIYHDLINLENDLLADEFSGFCEVDLSKLRIRIKKPFYYEIDSIPLAASFTDACSSNYAHWLTEVLPRIAVFCNLDEFQNIPLIVDQLPHSNLIEALAVVAKGRKIYFISEKTQLFVKSLYLTSVSGYVPFDLRNQSTSSLSGGFFNPNALGLLRIKLFDELAKLPKLNYPKNFYVRRRLGSNKRIKNGVELEDILLNQGFVIVEIEDLTFIQQVMLFSNAEKIICSSGSALSNLIFADSKCDIRVPIIKHRYANYSYWQNIACACGISITYLFGNEDLSTSDIHSDFSLDLNLL